jgi:mRNA-degrading endonuclease toxin of MazEF toxin-antitoxin module
LAPLLRWAVLAFDFDPHDGHEQGGQRRGLIVSYEPLHRSGVVTVCPITAAERRVARDLDVAIPVGEAGQTKPGHIICSQVRTISLLRARASLQSGQGVRYVTDHSIRGAVRQSLAIHLGLDIPGLEDGADDDAAYQADL